MKHIRKPSIKSTRGGKHLKVTFAPAALTPRAPETCAICGGKVEAAPMMRGVCYSCYSAAVISPDTFQALKQKVAEQTEQEAYTRMDQVLGPEPATQREMESMVEIFGGAQ